jgi:hypothetical protein
MSRERTTRLFSTIQGTSPIDRVIQLDSGALRGLPDQYQPALFSITERKLAIGSQTVTFPECIWKYWGHIEEDDIRFTASWYHERSLLPPYLSIQIRSRDTKMQYHLLLSLDTLEIIYLERVIESGGATMFERITLDQTCKLEWKVLQK